jgi:DNA-binding ferritin-like protein
MTEFLKKLLASMIVLQYKHHCIHTDARGALFLPFHDFMNSVYSFFGDANIDLIRERIRILGDYPGTSLSSALKDADIEELQGEVPALGECMTMVREDLNKIIAIVDAGIDISTEEKDLVTQNMLIDFNTELGKFEWKLRSTLGMK